MSVLTPLTKSLLFACFLLSSTLSLANEIHLAVASNFAETMTVITKQFENKTNHTVNLTFGSTGKHYAQIINGASFDAFFAADTSRPKRLENEAIALPDSRFTYAIGKLVLWSPKLNYVDSQGKILEHGTFRYLAIANPKLAPYGKAAQQILQYRGLWTTFRKRLVRGENIGQTYQYVMSGNAELGFVAYSQVKRPDHPLTGSVWEVPNNLYTPIKQQAVLLKDNAVAREFLLFIRSEEILKIIHEYGYDTP
jgi:molybdate transport system substrate-binding protein